MKPENTIWRASNTEINTTILDKLSLTIIKQWKTYYETMKQTLDIKQVTCHNWQANRGCCLNRKYLFPHHHIHAYLYRNLSLFFLLKLCFCVSIQWKVLLKRNCWISCLCKWEVIVVLLFLLLMLLLSSNLKTNIS